jgi:hypothetical protein
LEKNGLHSFQREVLTLIRVLMHSKYFHLILWLVVAVA